MANIVEAPCDGSQRERLRRDARAWKRKFKPPASRWLLPNRERRWSKWLLWVREAVISSGSWPENSRLWEILSRRCFQRKGVHSKSAKERPRRKIDVWGTRQIRRNCRG